jgi:hypothetical protein
LTTLTLVIRAAGKIAQQPALAVQSRGHRRDAERDAVGLVVGVGTGYAFSDADSAP